MATEKFYYEGIKSSFELLNGKFEEFASCLEKLNNNIQENINVGANSGVLGSYGTSIINLWNNNASTFGDFYKNFDSWSATVISLASSNRQYEGLTADMFANYQSNGGTLDGVANLRLSTAILQGATNLDGKAIYDENNSMVVKEIDPNTGEEVEVTYVRSVDQYGNAVVRKYDKDGNLLEVKLVCTNGQNPILEDNGNETYLYEFKDANGNPVTYVYDKNGNIIEEYSIDANGNEYCVTHTDENGEYASDVNDRYLFENGDWKIDPNQITEECASYIDSVSDNSTIDFSKVNIDEIDVLKPEVKEMVIDSITDKFLENCECDNVMFDPDFEKLPMEIQDNILNTLNENAETMVNKFTDENGATGDDYTEYTSMSNAEKAAVDVKLKENFDKNISSPADPLKWTDKDWKLYDNLTSNAQKEVKAELGCNLINRGTDGNGSYINLTYSNGNNNKIYPDLNNGTIVKYDAKTGIEVQTDGNGLTITRDTNTKVEVWQQGTTTTTKYPSGFNEKIDSTTNSTSYEVDGNSFKTYDTGAAALKGTAGDVYYANSKDSYVNCVNSMKPGDSLVVSCDKLAFDEGFFDVETTVNSVDGTIVLTATDDKWVKVIYANGTTKSFAKSEVVKGSSLNGCKW